MSAYRVAVCALERLVVQQRVGGSLCQQSNLLVTISGRSDKDAAEGTLGRCPICKPHRELSRASNHGIMADEDAVAVHDTLLRCMILLDDPLHRLCAVGSFGGLTVAGC